MSRVEYRMSAEDVRTFDRWHARGAMVLLAVLLTMPWILGIGPNAVRPADGPATIAAPPEVEAPPAAAGSDATAPATPQDATAPAAAPKEPAAPATAPATAPTPGATSGG